MLAFLLSLLVGGLVIGALGRLLVPGPNPMSAGVTIAVGVVGSLVGGWAGYFLFGRPGGWVLAVVCAALIVWALDRSRTRRVA